MEFNIIPKKNEFGENDDFKISTLHALFDSYLQPNLGNDPIKSLKFFKEVLSEKINLYSNEYEIINTSIIYDRRSFDIYREINITYDILSPSKKRYNERNIQIKDIKINIFEKNDHLMYNRKKIYSLFEFIRELSNIYNYQYNLFDQLLISSGWKTNTGGHLISLYYEKKKYDLYELIIFNSGDGIDNHEKYDDNFYNISRYRTATENEVKEILNFFNLFSCIIFNSDTNVSEIYYEMIDHFNFEKSIDNSTNESLKKICKQLPQLSGSCTYFGFYYNLLYILQKNEKNLEDFKNEVIIYAQKDIINYLEKKEFITDFDKNYIDLINIEKLDDNYLTKYNGLYSKYKNDLKKVFFNYINNSIKDIEFEKKNIEIFDFKNENIYYLIEKLLNIVTEIFEKKSYDYTTIMFIISNLRYVLNKDEIFFNLDKNYFENFVNNLHELEFKILLKNKENNNHIGDYCILFQLICIKVIENNDYLKNLFIYENLELKNDYFNYNLADLHFISQIYIKPLEEKYFELYKKYYNLINFKSIENNNWYTKNKKRIYQFNKDDFYKFFKKIDNDDKFKKSIIKFVMTAGNSKFTDKIISGINILKFKIEIEYEYSPYSKEVKDINKIVYINEPNYWNTGLDDEFSDKLNSYYYINPYKVIELINDQNVNNINLYYDTFFYKSEILTLSNLIQQKNNTFLFDEFNLFRFDVFNVNFKKNDIIYYEEPKKNGNDIINFSYSSIYQKNYSLLQNLDKKKLLNIFNELNDFSLLCIIILLYFYDYKLDDDLKEKIINYNIKEKEIWNFSFNILNILISDEIDIDKFNKIYYSNNNLKGLRVLGEFAEQNLTINHVEVLLLSLIFDRFFDENKDILLFNILFSSIDYNKIKFSDENIKEIQQNNNDIIIRYEKFEEVFLYVNYNKYTKYLNNFIFKKNKDIKFYTGISKIFDYQLNLEVSNDKLIIKRFINKNEYRLIDNENNYNFEWVNQHKNILIFEDVNNKENIIIEIYTKKYFENTNNVFRLLIKEKNKLFLIDSKGNQTELINENHNKPIFQKWIYNIPFSFLYKDGFKYKILFMDLKYMDDYLHSVWNNPDDLIIYHKIKYQLPILTENDKFYSAEISYNGLELIFNNKESMYIYIKLCIFFSKSDCLYSLINKINFQEVEIYNKKLKSTKKIEEVKLYDKQLYFILKCKLYNSPYSEYFEQIININNNYKNNKNYFVRLDRGTYSQKYKLLEKNNNDEYNTISLEFNNDIEIVPFNNFTKEIEIVSKIIINRNNNLTQQQNEYYTTILNKYSSNEYIGNDIRLFREKYEKCDLQKSVILPFKNFYEDLFEKENEVFEALEDTIVLSIDNINTIILKNIILFYELLDIKILKETLLKIQGKIFNPFDSPSCTEVSRIFDSIYNKVLYTEIRNKEIMLFEIFFGSYIRKEQYSIYKSICDEIDENENPKYKIYQLLMGRGKTSVILPLIALRYIFKNDDNIINNIICLPSHLVSQTYKEIKDKYSFMLNHYPIFKFSDIKRNKKNKENDKKNIKEINEDEDKNVKEINEYKYEKINEDEDKNENKKIKRELFFLNLDNKYKYKKIIIAECNSLKVLKLNLVENDDFDSDILKMIKKRSLLIFDEFDSLYNPLNSDLNFPINDKKNIYEIIDESIIYFYLDLIEFIFSNYNEINEINEEMLDNFLKNNNSYENEINLLKNKLINEVNILEKENSENSLSREKKLLNLKILKMYEILKECLNLVYNKDYGFPTIKSHDDLEFAVPYSHVNNPVENSKFSDIDINFFMTYLTYIKSDFRIYDIKNIIKIIQTKLNLVKKIFNDNSLINFIKPYNDMIGEFNIKKLLLVDYNLNENEHYLEEYKSYFSKLDVKEKLYYKKYYVLNNIIPKLELNPYFLNCSFIDIMCKNFSEKKSGFSGTVNLKLPILNDDKIDNCKYTINEKSNNYMNEFIGIESSPQDNGSMYIAILGLFSYKQDLYTFNKSADKINKISQIIEVINKNNYNSFIDSGAFLIDFTVEEAIKIFYNNINKSIFIYINNNDEKKVRLKGDPNEYDYKNEIFNTVDLFIYYDNKHIIGTDIKQPNELRGLVSVSSFNKITDIAQASFRLRQLNYGHIIDFIIDNELNKVNNRIKLLDFLNNNENNYICNESEIKKIQQNINYLKRSNNKDSFIDKKYIYYININEAEKFKNYLYINYYLEWIKSIKDKNKNNLIDNLYEYLIKSLEKNNNFNLSQEQEQEQQQEQQLQKKLIVENKLKYSKNIDINLKPRISKNSTINVDTLLNFNQNYNKFVNISDIIYASPNFNLNIRFSFLFMYLNTNYINGYNTDINFDFNIDNIRDDKYEKIIKEFQDKLKNSYLSILKLKNAYYLEKNEQFLIISPIEFEFIFDYYMNNNVDLQIKIYDKYGRLITFNKEIKKIEYNENPSPKPIEYFIKYILGSDLKLIDYFYMFNLIKNNKEELKYILESFKYIYNTNYLFEKFIDNNELIFNNETFYKLLRTEFGFDISILSQNENIKEYLDNIEKQITEYLNKQDGGFNFINHLLKQLGGYKKNSRLHNGKNLIKNKIIT